MSYIISILLTAGLIIFVLFVGALLFTAKRNKNEDKDK